jgi:hypothetical protein
VSPTTARSGTERTHAPLAGSFEVTDHRRERGDEGVETSMRSTTSVSAATHSSVFDRRCSASAAQCCARGTATG